jgi:hypothetical protein
MIGFNKKLTVGITRRPSLLSARRQAINPAIRCLDTAGRAGKISANGAFRLQDALHDCPSRFAIDPLDYSVHLTGLTNPNAKRRAQALRAIGLLIRHDYVSEAQFDDGENSIVAQLDKLAENSNHRSLYQPLAEEAAALTRELFSANKPDFSFQRTLAELWNWKSPLAQYTDASQAARTGDAAALEKLLSWTQRDLAVFTDFRALVANPHISDGSVWAMLVSAFTYETREPDPTVESLSPTRRERLGLVNDIAFKRPELADVARLALQQLAITYVSTRIYGASQFHLVELQMLTDLAILNPSQSRVICAWLLNQAEIHQQMTVFAPLLIELAEKNPAAFGPDEIDYLTKLKETSSKQKPGEDGFVLGIASKVVLKRLAAQGR